MFIRTESLRDLYEIFLHPSAHADAPLFKNGSEID